MSDESRVYIERLGEGLMRIVAKGQREEILKAVPLSFLNSLFIGSVREPARLIRAGSITTRKKTEQSPSSSAGTAYGPKYFLSVNQICFRQWRILCLLKLPPLF